MPKPKLIERPTSESKTRFQKFEYQEIPRSQIQKAPYNPRRISEHARKLLKKKLEQVGCVEPLVWNQKTGNLVSGHQRLSILDELEGSENYTVAVAVVDLSEKREKELNVFLNNTGAQGHYDRDEFLALLDDGLSLDDIGFTKVDLEFEFGEIPDGLFASERAAVETTLDELNLIKDRKKKYRELSASDPSDDSDYYVMVCFNSATEKNEWLKANQFPLDIRMVAATEIEVSRKT